PPPRDDGGGAETRLRLQQGSRRVPPEHAAAGSRSARDSAAPAGAAPRPRPAIRRPDLARRHLSGLPRGVRAARLPGRSRGVPALVMAGAARGTLGADRPPPRDPSARDRRPRAGPRPRSRGGSGPGSVGTRMSVAQGTEILGALVGRELRVRYKGSALGVLWAVLSPLGFVAILSLLFTRFMPLNIPDYAAFVYSGLLPWTWFDATLPAGCVSLLDNRDLVRKPFFPRAVLPAVVAGSQFALYLLALPVLLGLVLAHGRAPRETLLLLPAIWLVEGALAVA